MNLIPIISLYIICDNIKFLMLVFISSKSILLVTILYLSIVKSLPQIKIFSYTKEIQERHISSLDQLFLKNFSFPSLTDNLPAAQIRYKEISAIYDYHNGSRDSDSTCYIIRSHSVKNLRADHHSKYRMNYGESKWEYEE